MSKCVNVLISPIHFTKINKVLHQHCWVLSKSLLFQSQTGPYKILLNREVIQRNGCKNTSQPAARALCAGE